jgi:two-component system sensor histidine kinase KdpD
VTHRSPFLNDQEDKKEQNGERFLDRSAIRRGKFKIIGMSAGVWKTYRMLQEAHTLLKNGMTSRSASSSRTAGLKQLHWWKDSRHSAKKALYKGKELDEMDVQAVLNIHPEW